MKEFSLICVIVNEHLGSKVIKVTKSAGARGATVFYGKGIVGSKLLQILGIDYLFKEIVLIVVEKEMEAKILSVLNEDMSLEKPNHGIAFSVSLNNFIRGEGLLNPSPTTKAEPPHLQGAVIGTSHVDYYEENNRKEKSEEGMFEAIFTVVNKGSAEDVIDAAKSEGAKGGTIINARGSGIHETEMLFAMEIEPEKEIVLILTKKETTQKIIEAICQKMKIREPGNGIIFTTSVNQAVGLIG
jgi:nitrogen regulatory protein PII